MNRNNPDDVISREAYTELPEQDKQLYKGVKNRETRMLFNIDQTLLPMSNETEYNIALRKNGNVEKGATGPRRTSQLHGHVTHFSRR